LERLHVRIARSGICSRRTAEKLIADGRVVVNGELVVEMGRKVGPDDRVEVDGETLDIAKTYTVLLNKPLGVVTTLFDPQGRPTVARYLPNYGVQLKPVGRLDMDTEGLLLVTNDGELANRLAHPRYGIDKEYQATVEGVPGPAELEKLERGVFIEGRKTNPAKVKLTYRDPRDRFAVLTLVLHEGRNRQVRLMCEAVGHPVTALKRIRIGHLVLRGMKPGEAKLLGQKEVNELKRAVGIE
jgi:23S rRNA pseudouridine2605 synthase